MPPKLTIFSVFLLLMVLEKEETIDDNLPLKFSICYLLTDFMVWLWTDCGASLPSESQVGDQVADPGSDDHDCWAEGSEHHQNRSLLLLCCWTLFYLSGFWIAREFLSTEWSVWLSVLYNQFFNESHIMCLIIHIKTIGSPIEHRFRVSMSAWTGKYKE